MAKTISPDVEAFRKKVVKGVVEHTKKYNLPTKKKENQNKK